MQRLISSNGGRELLDLYHSHVSEVEIDSGVVRMRLRGDAPTDAAERLQDALRGELPVSWKIETIGGESPPANPGAGDQLLRAVEGHELVRGALDAFPGSNVSVTPAAANGAAAKSASGGAVN